MAKILIVEDDRTLAGRLRDHLVLDKLNIVEMVHDGTLADEYLRSLCFDVIILDWELPGKQGIEICQTFRAGGGTTPILFLTGRSATKDKIAGLDTGAEDYLTKPFQLDEVSARMRALLRRVREPEGKTMLVGGLEIDLAQRTVTRGGAMIELLPLEFDLLVYLSRRKGDIANRESLASDIWRDEFTSSATISKAISRLRSKIECDGEQLQIVNVKGLGYRLE